MRTQPGVYTHNLGHIYLALQAVRTSLYTPTPAGGRRTRSSSGCTPGLRLSTHRLASVLHAKSTSATHAAVDFRSPSLPLCPSTDFTSTHAPTYHHSQVHQASSNDWRTQHMPHLTVKRCGKENPQCGGVSSAELHVAPCSLLF